MLRYWWLWTGLVALVFGVSAGLSFLSTLIFLSLTMVTALNLGSAVGSLKEGEWGDGAKAATVFVVCFWILIRVWGWVIAIAGVVIALLGLILFCRHMAKKG